MKFPTRQHRFFYRQASAFIPHSVRTDIPLGKTCKLVQQQASSLSGFYTHSTRPGCGPGMASISPAVWTLESSGRSHNSWPGY
ncbi:hypothetical protein PoB_000630600 [Plakobranchus ocellatus]|uniref:Uncharacterized protein n=1 Tax=Plakobranchus ocellatus TaxID=259542 RepID=A0AAV3Y9A4_9GAST|nr:hypothetical protein PoB_000630600 [Plakobranchus ocellatus]